MSFINKIGKAFKAVGKAIVRVTKKVFKSKIFNIATTALSFIPGLNIGGLVGKALSFLGGSGKIMNFLKTGFNIFKSLTGKFKLSDLVKSLPTLPFQPLGSLLSKFPGLPSLQSHIPTFKSAFGNLIKKLFQAYKPILPPFLKQLPQLIGSNRSFGSIMPPGISNIISNIASHVPMDPGFSLPSDAFQFVDQLYQNPEFRFNTILNMFNELLTLTGEPSSVHGQVIIR